ncbi:ROK family protein [Bacteroidales bacterium OttesenSCG-928-A17]|nr:ROK family protein [Bacteroidales bacterium OttesenSCG-928-A17]
MNKSYVVGIDMGGTNTVFGIVDARGNIILTDSIPTTAYDTGEAYIDALGAAVNKLIERSGLREEIKGIGMGAPNGNMYAGTLEKAANIPWARNKVVPVAKMLSDVVKLPVKLTNDANAAALGEMIYGAAKGMNDFIIITLGTGLGSGIVANGKLVVGHDGNAGELGHVLVTPFNGRPCGCGRSGCLETYASATGVARTARDFIDLYPEKDTDLRLITDRAITSKDVFLAAQKGDELAIEVFNYTGKFLGRAFADFIAFSSPEAIILFGGLAHAGDYLMKPLLEELDKRILSVFKGKTKVMLSQLPDADAAVLGASALAWEL